ncbi:tRNA uridine-5-carboxymethylaminomethyl(34) synthesis GTPase MnmE [bacterium]|nr:MAG: tRNA uridine-5-carboxymethylaminomethyl(34) synthesis GTPase MnmE [bacterium]
MVYGILHSPDYSSTDINETGYEIDRCLAVALLGTQSFTGEDTVEFHCHGGREVARQVLAACRKVGARPAEPGEFTRRAFLNGKLSLDQAEAVADLIGARSTTAARAALRQLTGGLDRQLRDVEQPLLDLAASLEGSFDFVDEEEVEVPGAEVARVLTEATARIDELLAMAPAGRILRDGVQVVLTGLPNVGKSSLFNALLEEDRAIVDEEAGTTRDVVTDQRERDGVVYVLHDTAGLRDEAGRVEAKGIDRTHRQLDAADVVLLLSDGTSPPVLKCAAPVITVATKADLLEHAAAVQAGTADVVVSSRDGQGLEELWSLLEEQVRSRRLDEAVSLGVVLNERHRHRLGSCRAELAELTALMTAESIGPEVVATMLAAILARLGEVSGRVFTEHLLAGVFDRFCVGK